MTGRDAAAAVALALLAGPASAATVERVTVTPTAVHDGDTFCSAAGCDFRLAYVDAPETAARNRRWAEQPGAIAAREALAGLVLGRRLECVVVGRSWNRDVVDRRRDDGLDPAAVMVELGAAMVDPDNGGCRLAAVEREAREAGRGVWIEADPVPPWAWRNPKARPRACKAPRRKGRG